MALPGACPPARAGLGSGAPGLELAHCGGVQGEAAGEREGAAAGHPHPVGGKTLNFEGQPFDGVGWGEPVFDPPLPPSDGELRERRPDVDAQPDLAAGPGGSLGLGGNRHWNRLVRMPPVVD